MKSNMLLSIIILIINIIDILCLIYFARLFDAYINKL